MRWYWLFLMSFVAVCLTGANASPVVLLGQTTGNGFFCQGHPNCQNPNHTCWTYCCWQPFSHPGFGTGGFTTSTQFVSCGGPNSGSIGCPPPGLTACVGANGGNDRALTRITVERCLTGVQLGVPVTVHFHSPGFCPATCLVTGANSQVCLQALFHVNPTPSFLLGCVFDSFGIDVNKCCGNPLFTNQVGTTGTICCFSFTYVPVCPLFAFTESVQAADANLVDPGVAAFASFGPPQITVTQDQEVGQTPELDAQSMRLPGFCAVLVLMIVADRRVLRRSTPQYPVQPSGR